MTGVLDRRRVAPDVCLAQRLRSAAEALGFDDPPGAVADAGGALARLVTRIGRAPSPRCVWLFLVAIGGCLPTPGIVETARRKLAFLGPAEVLAWLLEALLDDAITAGVPTASLEVVTDRALVDVDSAVRHPTSVTGIQRVVRETVGFWGAEREIVPVAWNDAGGAYRRLTAHENELLRQPQAPNGIREDEENENPHLIIPWGAPLVVFDVPSVRQSQQLQVAAEVGAVSLRLVGRDCAPVVSAELVAESDSQGFGMYLEMLKHADRVAGISECATREFASFGAAIAAQGLTGPTVQACPLPTTMPVGFSDHVGSPDMPEVLCVGSMGRREGQLVLVQAAELLWREGLKFRLRLIGSGGVSAPVLDQLTSELKNSGRSLEIERRVSDQHLRAAYRSARCLVFLSLHEGFGLPIVEALSHSVPVITSDFGSMREVAAGGGALLVDPENVTAVAAAVRSLITDDTLHAQLVAEARQRPEHTWEDYARELAEVLLG